MNFLIIHASKPSSYIRKELDNNPSSLDRDVDIGKSYSYSPMLQLIEKHTIAFIPTPNHYE